MRGALAFRPGEVAREPEMLGQGEHDGTRSHAVDGVHVSPCALRADGMGEASEAVREVAEWPVGLGPGVGAFDRAYLS